MLRNSPTSWGRVARTLHWTFAIFIAAEVAAGFIMSRTYASKAPATVALHHLMSNFHHTVGILFLLAVAGRLAWRLTGPVPEAPAGQPRFMLAAAAATHWLMYGLLVAIPLSGWAALSALADSERFGRTMLWFFGVNAFDHGLPRLVPAVDWNAEVLLNYSNMARSHRWLLIAGACLLTVHVAAALWHHFIRRDDVLRRMLGAGPAKGA